MWCNSDYCSCQSPVWGYECDDVRSEYYRSSKYTDRVLPPLFEENFQHVTLTAVLDMVNVCIPILNAQVPVGQ